ncbi:MAG: ATP-binding protein [Myxococcota bacterium]
MERFFNTAGPINPADHYALDPLHRWDLPKVLSLIDQKKYFLLHAPRQTGKTTCLNALRDHLNQQGRLRCVYINVEAAQAAVEDVAEGTRAILYHLGTAALRQAEDDFVDQNWQGVLAKAGPLQALGAVLSLWCQHSDKPIVLLIDEIDALVGKMLIAVLRQLRAGYVDRFEGLFPQSVTLCGLRDIRDYRVNHEDRAELQRLTSAGSPFNIKSDSLRLGDFSQEDVKTLYAQHTQETDQQFAEGVCERVFELTQGQPWLVNALAYDVCFEDQAGRDRTTTITLADIDTAKERLIQRRETHLDQLLDKLKQERVHRVMQNFLLGENCLVPEDDIEYVIDLGLLRQSPGKSLRMANPIYREIIPRALSSEMQRQVLPRRPAYVDQEGRLCVEWLMTEFQQFFRENSDSWLDQFQYKEAGPHLILQAFLQRVVNGGGTIHREYALGRGRTDLVVTWPISCRPRGSGDPDQNDRYGLDSRFPGNDKEKKAKARGTQVIVLELKLVHPKRSVESTMNRGLEQTAQYMDTCGATEGHLILFDRRDGKSWDERIWTKQETAPDGKNITVWAM